MKQKIASASSSGDGTVGQEKAQLSDSRVHTAPEVSYEVAKQYGVHKESLYQASEVEGTPGFSPGQPEVTAENADDFEEPETAAAVDDVLSHESDELLGIIDDKAATQAQVKQGLSAKLKKFFRSWWCNKIARYVSLAFAVTILLTLAMVPATRYGVLNFVGVRSSALVVVLDDTTQLPLKNVTVSLSGQTVQTDRKGVARLRDLKLGKYQLEVKRIAFASYRRPLTIGWGSNPLGSVRLRAVGMQYQLAVKDYLSGKPIAGAEAESEGLNALSDNSGKITLTIEDTSITKLALKVSAPGYRSETMELTASAAAASTVTLVPAQKAVYVSRASGKYDVYSSYLDGKDKQILLPGSGQENNNISLVVSPDNKQAALVSTRDNLRDADGYLLYALTFINIEEGTSITVDHAQQLQLVDWTGDRLIYRSTIAGASGSNPQRNRLIAYSFTTNARLQLAAANQFNTILSANGYVYYAVASSDPRAALGLFRIKPDNSGRERLSEQEVWTGLRTNIHTLSLQTPEGWLSYDLNAGRIQKAAAPPTFVSTNFTVKNNRTAWVEVRDGKGALLVTDNTDDKPTVVASQPGLAYPVGWLGDTVLVYRVVNDIESADYVVSINGGSPRKLSDVTATYGYIQAY